MRRATGKANKLAERKLVFLSTLSLRRATRSRPWGPGQSGISIHALLAESDRPTANSEATKNEFLSTLSLRRATNARPETRRSCAISIHALLAESDNKISPVRIAREHFYPRSPCGERPSGSKYSGCSARFLSTLSLRRATDTWTRGSRITYVISIHALLAESDGIKPIFSEINTDFYPRSPCGERPLR